MNSLILIGVGSGLGGIGRYLLSAYLYQLLGQTFPYGTLAVNVLGSFLVGFIFILLVDRFVGIADQMRALLIIGFLGGFTTFSSFSMETIALFGEGEIFRASLNILSSIILCLSLTWIGILLARQI